MSVSEFAVKTSFEIGRHNDKIRQVQLASITTFCLMIYCFLFLRRDVATGELGIGPFNCGFDDNVHAHRSMCRSHQEMDVLCKLYKDAWVRNLRLKRCIPVFILSLSCCYRVFIFLSEVSSGLVLPARQREKIPTSWALLEWIAKQIQGRSCVTLMQSGSDTLNISLTDYYPRCNY